MFTYPHARVHFFMCIYMKHGCVVGVMECITMEYAEYVKSEAPKLTPSNTNASELIGCVAATN